MTILKGCCFVLCISIWVLFYIIITKWILYNYFLSQIFPERYMKTMLKWKIAGGIIIRNILYRVYACLQQLQLQRRCVCMLASVYAFCRNTLTIINWLHFFYLYFWFFRKHTLHYSSNYQRRQIQINRFILYEKGKYSNEIKYLRVHST